MDLGLGTLTELKAHLLNEGLRDQVTYDTAIANLGRGIAARFERFCDRKFARVTGETFEADADRRSYSLPRFPIESITKLEQRDDLATGWVDLGAPADVIFNLRENSGLVEFAAELGLAPSRLRFTYTGGFWYPGRGAPQTLRDTIDLTTSAESQAIVFSSAFSSVPAVRVALILPNGAVAGMSVWPAAATTLGFTAVFGAPVPAGTKLSWSAIGTPISALSARLQSGFIDLAAGAESVALAFPVAFADAPQLTPVIILPTAGAAGVTVWASSVTAAGATIQFGAPIPGAGYQLGWIALGEALEEDDELQRGTLDLAAAATYADIPFDTGFEEVPALVAQVVAPDGSASGIEAWVVGTSLLASGARVEFSAPVPGTGYTLHWHAASMAAQPAGSIARPDDLFLAWLLQCEHVWGQRDALGLSLNKDKAGVSPELAGLSRVALVPEVEAILRGYRRYAL